MFGKKEPQQFKYPGKRMAMDGNTAVIMCERESSDAAGAYPITPSTQMGEYWAEETANGHVNVSGRPLIFVEPESEHAAAGVTAGMSAQFTGDRFGGQISHRDAERPCDGAVEKSFQQKNA